MLRPSPHQCYFQRPFESSPPHTADFQTEARQGMKLRGSILPPSVVPSIPGSPKDIASGNPAKIESNASSCDPLVTAGSFAIVNPPVAAIIRTAKCADYRTTRT